MSGLGNVYSELGTPVSTMQEALSNLKKYLSEADDEGRRKLEANLAKETVGNQAESMGRYSQRQSAKTGGMTPLQGLRIANLGKTAKEEAYQQNLLTGTQNAIQNKLSGLGMLSSLTDTQNKLYGTEANYTQGRTQDSDEQIYRQLQRILNQQDKTRGFRNTLEDIQDEYDRAGEFDISQVLKGAGLSIGGGVLGNITGRAIDRYFENKGNDPLSWQDQPFTYESKNFGTFR